MTWSATHTLPGGVRVAWHTTDGCIDRVSVIGADNALESYSAVYDALKVAGCGPELEDLDVGSEAEVTWEAGEAGEEQVACLARPHQVREIK